jgi:hypothetical protein
MMAISRAVLFSRTMNFDCNIHNEEEGGGASFYFIYCCCDDGGDYFIMEEIKVLAWWGSSFS